MKCSVLVELVEHLLGLGATLQFDDDAHAAPVRLIPQVRDGIDFFVTYKVGNAFDQGRLVDLVGDFGDDDAVPVTVHLLNVRFTAQDDPALPGTISGFNTFRSDNDTASGEIRSGDEFHQKLDRHLVHRVVVFDQVYQRRCQLFQIVRRDIGGHANGNS